MGSKVRCPACGAKNDASSRRCRVCTVVINAEIPEGGVADTAPDTDGPAIGDLFDAGVIDRQLQPTRAKFGDDAGGLAARLAAARAAKAAQSSAGSPSSAPPAAPAQMGPAPTGPTDSFGSAPVSSPAPPARPAQPVPSPAPATASGPGETFEPLDPAALGARPAPPTAPPIEHESEPFDPDALFRDMG